jgi:tRNA nucleotidyltransferase/poly(A) polymerase
MMEDAQRRDFTINALFYDPIHHEVLDFVGGVEDLNARVLRTVGAAEERFEEDRLRMLRAARFNAQLGFPLDQSAVMAIRKLHKELKAVSSERIFAEMKRLLSSAFVVDGLSVMQSTQMDAVVWPELAKADLGQLKEFQPLISWEQAFAAVMLLADAPSSEERLRAWKAPRESIRHVHAILEGSKTLTDSSSTRATRMRILGGEDFAEVLLLAKGVLHRDGKIQEWIEDYLKLTGPSARLPKPLLTGQDLLDAGLEPGEKMGLLLKLLFEQQLEGKISTKAEALAEVKKH